MTFIEISPTLTISLDHILYVRICEKNKTEENGQDCGHYAMIQFISMWKEISEEEYAVLKPYLSGSLNKGEKK